MIPVIECLEFPAAVFRGKGALDSVGTFCRTLGENALVFGGKTALAKTEENISTSLRQAGVQIAATKWYGGECSRCNIDALVEEAKNTKADVLIAVGGGKALDTGKLVAEETGLPVLTIPTVAATCAAVTPVSVVYTDEGEFEEMVVLRNCPAGTVIDTVVILDSPLRWLAAGMGDTLAKWYEYRVSIKCVPQNSLTLGALASGKLCYDLVERFGGDARQALEAKVFNEALDSTVDAIILHAGIASILGGEKIRSAAAHGFYNGLTKIPSAREAGHGLAVGYGNLFLLALEDRPDEEIIEAIIIAERCAVPTTLAQLIALSEEELHIVASAILLTPDMKNMPFDVSEDMVIKAVRRVDRLARSRK
jgi:glycerol dehydrogenase-like iron-containing ADH family enzyme